MTRATAVDSADGPFFDQLEVGQRITSAPALTLTPGHAAAHQAIVGDRLRLALDADLSHAVTGEGTLAHPALVWDVAIGQSTLVTRRVIANLFYRGLVFRRAPMIGDRLSTVTEVIALRQNKPKPARAATGMAVLRMRTVDHHGRAVLDFLRCAMLPLSDPNGQTGADDDLSEYGREDEQASISTAVAEWRLDVFRDLIAGYQAVRLEEGQRWSSSGGDVVSSAPELARLTLNVARAHHDETHDGRRLVYGGHTIGLALAQLNRLVPDLVTVVGWRSCDHLGPVFEGDTLSSEVEVEQCRPIARGGTLVDFRSRVTAQKGSAGESRAVLDWRLIGVVAY